MRSANSTAPTLGLLFSVLSLLGSCAIAAYPQDVAFVNVNVVPMDRERVLEGQTVWISGTHIRAMGVTSKIALPKGTLQVNGSGKYLMPGLADMHGHLSHRGPAMTYPLETFPLLLVAHGITTLRNMAGYPAVLSLRQQIDSGATLGPQIFTTGPVIEGKEALTANNSATSATAALVAAGSAQSQQIYLDTAEDAAAEVQREKSAGYDAVKVYNLLPAPAYAAAVATANRVGLPVYGHVPRSVGLSGVLSTHIRSIEHLTGYMEALQTQDSPFKDSRFSPSNAGIAEHVDLTKLPALAAAIREAGVWNCPTLVLWSTATLKRRIGPTAPATARYAVRRPGADTSVGGADSGAEQQDHSGR